VIVEQNKNENFFLLFRCKEALSLFITQSTMEINLNIKNITLQNFFIVNKQMSNARIFGENLFYVM